MKLIVRPSQCAARITDTPSEPKGTYCTVNGSVFLPCPNAFEFPEKCPLKDGVDKEDVKFLKRKITDLVSRIISFKEDLTKLKE